MMGSKERAFAPLCNLSLDALVPADHFYRHLDAKLDLGFVRDLVADCYAAGGRPSIDQVVFFKLQLVMFFEGLRWRLRPRQVTGDTTYATGENIVAVEDQGIRAYVPLADWDRTPFYGPSRFAYDPGGDLYHCPEGHELRRLTAKYAAGATVYRAEAAVCNACPAKTACTASEHGRTIQRPFAAEYLDRVRDYQGTAGHQKALRKRSVWVEPLFGEAKGWHGLGRFRLRGLWRVNVEALLIATGQNLKRLLRKRGWGRRPWPRGAPGLAQASDRPPPGSFPIPAVP